MTRPRRPTIGSNPLDAVIPALTESTATAAGAARARTVSVGIAFDVRLLERARNAVYWTPGLTLAGLVNHGIALAVNEIERTNDGEPFPTRSGRMRTGRPLSHAEDPRNADAL